MSLNLRTIKKIENLIECALINGFKIIQIDSENITLFNNKCNSQFVKKHKSFLNIPRCNCKKCKSEYKKKLFKDKYGVEHPLQLQQIKDKIKKTNLDRYGVEWQTQSDNFKEKSKQTCLKKYGEKFATQSAQIKNKTKKTNLDKYGVDNPAKTKQIKDKIKTIHMKNFGVDNVFKSPEIKEKIKQTNLNKYGVENYTQTKEYKLKTKETNIKKYGFENPMQSKKIKNSCKTTKMNNYFINHILNLEHIKPLFDINTYSGVDDKYKWQCLKCNNKFKDDLKNGHFPRCPKCYPKLSGTSKTEKELQEWISSLNVKSENNKWFNKDKKRYELDVYIPEFNLGIELNGIYWHSELQGKDKNYHLNKSKWFKDNFGIDVIHIWDLEWIEEQNIIKSIIKNKLKLLTNKIYGRQTVIKKITVNEAKMFCEINHLQGFVGAKYHYGLFYNDELVSYMSLGKTRFNKMYDYELIRFANKIDHNIVGGFSKLLKYFTNNYKGSLISYVDRRYFNGQGYLKNGFKYIDNSHPNYFYTNDYNRLYSRYKYQKHKLKDKLNNFNENLTEWENMQLNGYDRIWDCGNMIMVL